jgi:hypothetical protein
MDPLLAAAAGALSAFDPLGALRLVALRDEPAALVLRGIAMAQLGDYAVARKLLGRAAAAFGPGARMARARCLAAEAEVALACRDLAAAGRGLASAAAALEAEGDHVNALFVRLQLARRLVLLGKLGEARRSVAALDLRRAPARLVAMAELVNADIAVRSLRSHDARDALGRARAAAKVAKIPSLLAEVDEAARRLGAPVARLWAAEGARAIALGEVETLVASGALVLDACRREARAGTSVVSLLTRPLLLSLAVALAEAAPGEATREALIARAFGGHRASDSLRARLRVEVGRLRRVLAPLADIRATPCGFAMTPRRGTVAHVLLPPAEGEASPLLALLGGGESWSTSALAAAVGSSQRAVQRALGALEAEGRVQAVGGGGARRWMAPPPAGFATTLLLVTQGRAV